MTIGILILGVDGVGAGGLGTDSGASSGDISNAPTPRYWRKCIAMVLFGVKMLSICSRNFDVVLNLRPSYLRNPIDSVKVQP